MATLPPFTTVDVLMPNGPPWPSGKGVEIGLVLARPEQLVALLQTPFLYEGQALFPYRVAPEIGVWAIEAEDLTDHPEGVDRKQAVLDLMHPGPCPFAIWVDKNSPHSFAEHKAYFNELFKAFELDFFHEHPDSRGLPA